VGRYNYFYYIEDISFQIAHENILMERQHNLYILQLGLVYTQLMIYKNVYSNRTVVYLVYMDHADKEWRLYLGVIFLLISKELDLSDVDCKKVNIFVIVL